MGIDAETFSQRWVDAWNAHDVDAVLDHFDDAVVFTSPVAAQVLPATGGRVDGKAALRDYWVRALSLRPDLHFTVEGVYEGSTSSSSTTGISAGLVNEVLRFAGDLVVEGHGTYLA